MLKLQEKNFYSLTLVLYLNLNCLEQPILWQGQYHYFPGFLAGLVFFCYNVMNQSL
jgi:hypothetical protein